MLLNRKLSNTLVSKVHHNTIYVTVFYIRDYYQGKCDLEPGNQQSVPSNSVTEHRVHMTAER